MEVGMKQGPILIVDDCRLTRAILQDMLTEAGYAVVMAESAIDANLFIEQQPGPSLILMDVVMPSLSGDRKVRRMKAHPSNRSIPVVLISTKPLHELHQLASSSGADACLRKPLNKSLLLETISRLTT
jgi:CheY-like chemotaxis protein